MMTNISDQLGLGSLFAPQKRQIDKNDVPSSLNKPMPLALQSDKFSTHDSATIGTQLLYQAISLRFSTFSSKQIKLGSPDVVNQPANVFDFKAVANNVLDFVKTTLSKAKAEGASDEKMSQLFKQARSGVEQGFNDALGELKSIAVFDSSLADAVGKSRDLIDQGINKLEKALNPNASSSINAGNIQSQLNYSSDSILKSSQTSDLTIRTTDGDIVTISFNKYQQNSAAQQLAYTNNGTSTQLNFQSSQSSYQEMNFSYSVQGNIDAGEKKAIDTLISDISKVQKSFFNGSLDKAFEKATKLGFDGSQISAFNLDLQQTQTSVVSQKYNAIAKVNEHDDKELKRLAKPVVDFANQMKAVRDNVVNIFGYDKSNNEEQQLQQLLNSIFNAEFGSQKSMQEKFNNFIKKIG